MKNIYSDVLIIGAGPVGMYTAFYCGLRNMDTVLVDSLGQIGGQVSALYPEKDINDLPGYPAIKAKDFIANLELQMQTVADKLQIVLNENITGIQKEAEQAFIVTTANGNVYHTKSIIITAGGGAFSPRLMGVDGEDNFTNIHYFINDMEQFRNRKVAIFGGGDSAVDWALMLEPIAEKVSIIHRRNAFRAKEANVDELKASRVDILTPYAPIKITGEQNLAQNVTLGKPRTDETMTLDIDDIIVNFGFLSSLGPVEDWGLIIENRKYILVDRMQQTNIPGIFACGDISTYANREEQITTGLAEGLTASSAAQRYVFPDLKTRPIR